jgi:hypothetical protein
VLGEDEQERERAGDPELAEVTRDRYGPEYVPSFDYALAFLKQGLALLAHP